MRTTLANSSVVVLCVVAVGLAGALPSVAEYDIGDAVGLWLLDDGEGDVAKDSSATGDDGDLWREPTWVDGRFGKALHFDGQSFIWIKEAKGIPEGATSRTVMCYFKWDEVNWDSTQTLINLGASAWRSMLTLSLHGGRGPGVYSHDDVEYFEWDGDTEWHHIAAVFPDGATKSDEFVFYLDGVLQEDTMMDDDINGLDFKGGLINIACSANISGFFKGIMDEIVIFPFEMSAENIASAAKFGLVKGQILSVSPTGKLATAWGTIKER